MKLLATIIYNAMRYFGMAMAGLFLAWFAGLILYVIYSLFFTRDGHPVLAITVGVILIFWLGECIFKWAKERKDKL